MPEVGNVGIMRCSGDGCAQSMYTITCFKLVDVRATKKRTCNVCGLFNISMKAAGHDIWGTPCVIGRKKVYLEK